MNILDQIVIRIIKEQELVVGPIAWQEAQKVDGLLIVGNESATINKDVDAKSVVNGLVSQYEHLFGKASKEVCKEAAGSLIADLTPSEVPQSLQ